MAGLSERSVTICSDVCHYRYMPLCSPASVLLAPQHHGHRSGCGAAKVQGFRKGDLVECRREDSLIYSAEVNPSSAIRTPGC